MQWHGCFERRSPPRSLVANAVWSLALNVWAAALGLLLTPLLIDRLGVERYGVFGLVEMAIFIFILVLGLCYAWRKGVLRWI